MKNILIPTLLTTIILVLLVNLFTPESTKVKNYRWIARFFPRIVNKPITVNSICQRMIINPDYIVYKEEYKKRQYIDLSKCKYIRLIDSYDCKDVKVSMDNNEPKKEINENYNCALNVGYEKYLYIFDILILSLGK